MRGNRRRVVVCLETQTRVVTGGIEVWPWRLFLDRLLVSEAWEELCRHRLPWMDHPVLGAAATWTPGGRWWLGQAPEWDIVAEDVDGTRVLLGEAKLGEGRGGGDVRRWAREVASRPAPELPARFRRHKAVRALFLPDPQRMIQVDDVAIVSLRHLMPR